jgi:hypothetical protein
VENIDRRLGRGFVRKRCSLIPDACRRNEKRGLGRVFRQQRKSVFGFIDESRKAMRNALKRIQDGEYAKMFIAEGAANYPSMTARRRNNAAHGIEVIGEQSWTDSSRRLQR